MNGRLFNKYQKGLTLIEALAVLALFAMIITSITVYISEANFDNRVQTFAKRMTSISLGVSKRVSHDGSDYNLWDSNGNRTAENDNELIWADNDEFSNGLLREFLTGRNNTGCGNVASGWNALNDDNTLDGGNEYPIEKTSLVPCTLFNGFVNFDLELQTVLNRDPQTDKVDKFIIYANFQNSDLYNEKVGVRSISMLVNTINNHFSNDILGSPNAGAGAMNVLSDPYDDVSYNSTECLNELISGRECSLILSLDFQGSNNGQYLEISGNNNMLAGISFSEGANSQKCIWWQNPNKTAADLGVFSEGTDVSVWTSKEVDCGVSGGNDSALVEAVLDNQYSTNYYVTNPTNLNHMCKVYEADGDGHLVDLASQINDGSTDTTPCGLLSNGDIVQLATEQAFIGQAFIKDVIAQEVFSNNLQIKHNPVYDNKIETLDKGVNAIPDLMADPTVLINVLDQSSVQQFTVDNNGYTHVYGTLEVDENGIFRQDVSVNGNLVVGGFASFNMTSGADVVFGTNDLTLNRATNFEMFTRNGLSLDILADNAELNLQGDTGLNIGSIDGEVNIEANGNIEFRSNGDVIIDNAYTTTHGQNGQVYDADLLDSLPNKEDFKLITKGEYEHLKDLNGNITFYSTVNIEAGINSRVSKPDCLDFVRSNPERYAGTDALTKAENDEGFNYSRIIIQPVFAKTYSSALGDNQILATHAVHENDREWEVYMYLSGEGVTGTGGREDGIGSAIGMILCDYNGVIFEN